jgi:hypothetical protein
VNGTCRLTLFDTHHIQQSGSFGRCSVPSLVGSVRRAVSREDSCGDSPSIKPLKMFRPFGKRVDLKVLQP